MNPDDARPRTRPLDTHARTHRLAMKGRMVRVMRTVLSTLTRTMSWMVAAGSSWKNSGTSTFTPTLFTSRPTPPFPSSPPATSASRA